MVSLLKGASLSGAAASAPIDTVNALGSVNGRQILASPMEIDLIKEHIRTFVSPYKDLRNEMRSVEQALLNHYAGFLIGNQCLDFQKQDGITEVSKQGASCQVLIYSFDCERLPH